MNRPSPLLIADDEPIFLGMVEDALRIKGFSDIHTSGSGLDAIRVVAASRPRLVLMDVAMPTSPIDGIDAADVIQSVFNVPVVLLTGDSTGSTLLRAKQVGVYGYIVKGSSFDAITTTLEMADYNFYREFEAGDKLIVTTEPNLNIIGCNPQFLGLLETKLENILGTPLSEHIQSLKHHALDSQPSPALTTEEVTGRLRFKNRKTIYLQGKARPIMKLGEVFGVRWSLNDVSLQKQAEQQMQHSLEIKTMLIGEIHHRFRNSLQFVLSSLEQASCSFNRPDFQRDIAEDALHTAQLRLRAMCELHEVLHRATDHKFVDMKAYIPSLIDAIGSFYSGHSINIEFSANTTNIDHILLSFEDANACGLILTELCINAVKYGFKNRSGGAVTVRFKREQDGTCRLSVKDNGIGMKTPYQSKGFGSDLIAGLATQLGAKLSQICDDGTTTELTFSPPQPESQF